MRKNILYILIMAILLFCLTSCANKDNANIAGTYEMIDVENMDYNEFNYCSLILNEKGEYALAYQKNDFDHFKEAGNFNVKESRITFFTGSISGEYEIEAKRFKLTLKLSDKSVKVLFVLTILAS